MPKILAGTREADNMVEQIASRRHVPTYMYYRQSNGWITWGAAGPIDKARFVNEGWIPLEDYGRFDLDNPYLADHPLEALLMRGGAKELPMQQVIEQGLWQNPPKVPSCRMALGPAHRYHRPRCLAKPIRLAFPQVPGDTPRAWSCHFCERELPTEQACNQHESVMHQKEKSELRASSTLAAAIVEGLKSYGAIGAASQMDVLKALLQEFQMDKVVVAEGKKVSPVKSAKDDT